MKKTIMLLTCLIFVSCGWNDGSWKEKNLIGNYKVVEDKNDIDSGFRLVLVDDDGSGYTPIIDNCSKIYLDSLKMYVKSKSFTGEDKYYEVLHKENNQFLRPFKVIDLTMSKFKEKISNCNNCTIHKYDDNR